MKCALVTGSSRGIGKAIAIQLAKDQGLHILINFSSNLDAAKDTLNTIESNGGSGELILFNVEHCDEVQSAITNWQKKNDDKHIEAYLEQFGYKKNRRYKINDIYIK